MRFFRLVPALVALSVLGWSVSSRAAEPSLDDCKKLQQEQIDLTNQGVLADLAKGPEWAKANLPANRLSLSLRYLHVYEQLNFQCENVFADAELAEERKKAAAEAQARARANIPPPPVRRPKITPVSRSKGNVRIPPLPQRGNKIRQP